MPPIESAALRGRALATSSRLGLLFGLPLMALLSGPAPAQAETPTLICGRDGTNVVNMLPQPNVSAGAPNLIVNDLCQVTTDSSATSGEWKFANVNIVDGGVLEFIEKQDTRIDFWASGIVIEKGGRMIAGRATTTPAPIPGNAENGSQWLQPVLAPAGRAFGELGGRLAIHLYGKDQSNNDPNVQGQGVVCRSQELDPALRPCGVDDDVWDTNGSMKVVLPNGVKDYFYQYDPLYMDGKADELGRVGYFGYKSIGVAYGGSLELYGAMGSMRPGAAEDPTDSGNSWVRLGATIEKGATSLTLDREPGAGWAAARWRPGAEIVVTSTDYLPDHSEQLTITAISGKTVSFKRSGCVVTEGDNCGVKVRHQGERFPLSTRLDKAVGPDGKPRLTIDPKLVADGAETRAAVALLTRSITIQSAGDTLGESFDAAIARVPNYSFGGHVVVRQGFEKLQVQGVEFKQLGQGGRKGHYPVHFHMARIVPNDSWIKDSSVNESMTRWVVIHSTQNMTIARNVGYQSIGHGFYLEDATEIDNRFHSNIGIHARAAVTSGANPRGIPGILVDNTAVGDSFPMLSDGNHPAVFWITNNWNEFIGNMAVGAGACGACYWLAPSYNDGSSHDGHMSMKWEGYAALQKNEQFAGATPLKAFFKNTCSSAMNSFMSINNTGQCQGVKSPAESEPGALQMVRSIAPPASSDRAYYPKVGDVPHSTHCPVAPASAQTPGMPTVYDCSNVKLCENGGDNCGVTVLDHYTTSFNWSEQNFAAVWLRQFWYLFDNSVITDVMTSGLTFVSGGDYTKSSSPEGYWALARNSIFIGETQPKNPLAWSIGAINTDSGLKCDNNMGNSCVVQKAGIAIPKSNWGVNQRFFNIYDGPNYQDSNAFLDITTRTCNQANGCIWAQTNTIGVRNDPSKGENASCFSPNAAIGWKQPNGFYYPPAFHSTNLFFDNVDIRHYVIAPVFKPVQPAGQATVPNFGQGGSYLTDFDKAKMQFCYFPTDGFNNFTDVDRQTELNDDDGSLTGFTNTISVNEDSFFSAPVETAECKSNVGVDPDLACNGLPLPASVVPTARTSPYDYVTTVMVPDCSQPGQCPGGNQGPWAQNCGGPYCYGVPIFRQFLVGSKARGTGEWANWQANGCDNATDGVARAACRWPFLRMAGQSTWQRSNLTANYGHYYIDTSVSENTQKTENFTTAGDQRSVNVFEAGKHYSLMFLFAKNATQQTYQIYVGKQFNKDTDVKPLRGNILTMPTVFSAGDNNAGWLETQFADGMLTIKVNFAKVTDLTPSKANGSCQPQTFCSMDGQNNCVCSLSDDDPMVLANPGIKASCNRACGHWAVKDMDCPKGGCYAVGITMGADLVADDVQRRPQPTEFPGPTVMSLAPGSGDRGWETLFSRTTTLPDGKPGGSCYYDRVPGTAACLSSSRN